MRMKKNDYLHIAMSDLNTARKNLAIQEYSAVTFYSQQCIEKSLKFLLENKRIELNLKTHNLRTLYRYAVEFIPQIAKYKTSISDISDSYFNSRYPGDDFYISTKIEAQNACSTAESVFNNVYNLINNKEEFPYINNTDLMNRKTDFFGTNI